MVIEFTRMSSTQTTNSSRARTEEQNAAAAKTKSQIQSGKGIVSGQSSFARGETVRLSDAAKTLRSMERKLADTPDVDSERVEQLKSEIENGTYQINSKRVAEKMMLFDRAL